MSAEDRPKEKRRGGFKPGVSGNPGGRPKLPPQVKEFKRLTQGIVDDIGFLVIMADEKAIYGIVHDPEASVLKKWIASVALSGLQDGNMDALDKLLNRLIGKPKDRIEHSGPDGKPIEHKNVGEIDDAVMDARIDELLSKRGGK